MCSQGRQSLDRRVAKDAALTPELLSHSRDIKLPNAFPRNRGFRRCGFGEVHTAIVYEAGPEIVPKPLRRGSTLLWTQIKVHGVGVHAPGANINRNHAPITEVCIRKRCHELARSNEPCVQRGAVPENDGVRAEVTAIDCHGEGHAVDWHTVGCQCRYRGWGKYDGFERITTVFDAVAASDGEYAGEHKTDVSHS